MNIAHSIDHTALKPNTTEEQIRTLCAEAKEYEFASVCVNPYWVSLAAELLQDSISKVCTVIGFPLGANTPESKAVEATLAITAGANELDMVLNIGALKSGLLEAVEQDMQAVRDAAPQAIVKVILETCLLTNEEIVTACEIAKKVGLDFVKTSTGFSTGGATVEDVALMRETVGPEIGVKASGGIRSYEDAEKMIEAGANRLGCSAGVAIVHGEISTSEY